MHGEGNSGRCLGTHARDSEVSPRICYGVTCVPAQHCCHCLSMTTWRGSDMSIRNSRDYLPDVRDGLTHRERVVLQCLHALQEERGGRNVPTGMLYGTVVEHVDMSVEEMQSILVRLIGHPLRP